MRACGRLSWPAIVLVCALACLPAEARAQQTRPPEPEQTDSRACGDTQELAEQREIGRAMARQIMAGSTVWGGARVNEYVSRLGQNLARSSGTRQVFTFQVLYSPELNAQTLPGGFVFVNSGMISAAESEAELASVLAHEIAHVNGCFGRPSSRQASLFNLLTAVPLTVLSGPAGIAMSHGNILAAPAAQARASRSAEREADRQALAYLWRAGYDPRAAIRILERVDVAQTRRGQKSGGLLATHPCVLERRRWLEKILAGLPPPPVVVENTREFDEVRSEVLHYDQVYASAVGALEPGEPFPAPRLARRPAPPSP